MRATSTLRALCVRVQSKRHAHTCNTATRLHDSKTTRRCGHSAVEYQCIAQGMHAPATPLHTSTLRELCVRVQFDDVCSSGYVKTRTRRDMCERWLSMNAKAFSVTICSCIFEKLTCRYHACCSSPLFFVVASFVLRPQAHAHPSCVVRNFHVFFFNLAGCAFYFLCRSMPSASLMTLNLSRSIGTRARRHAHTATNTCNTATHTCNTPTHLENSSTTQHNNPAACMPLYTPLRAHAHTGLNCCTHQGEKRPQKKKRLAIARHLITYIGVLIGPKVKTPIDRYVSKKEIGGCGRS